jgi:diketogulonate reductase-like aldo/keto reductase
LEEKLSQIDGCEWEWQELDGSVRITTEAVPAIRLVTDRAPAQNQVFQWTFSNSIVAAFLGWQDSRNNRHDALRFGTSNEKMPEQVLQSIADFMEENRILYTWNKGDVMALNNRLVMHSRNPFEGKRRVLASIWGGPKASVLLAQPANGVALGTHLPESFYRALSPADPLVFGFWKVPKKDCEEVCYQAIAAGYRRLDCACDYGNEEQVGRGIARAIKDGSVSRQDLFVTSKLWNTYHQHVSEALERTLQDLGLDYVDEYLIHFPISLEFVPFKDKYPPEWTNLEGKMVLVPNDIGATWKAMEDLVDQGLTKSIGVCNFSTQLLRQLLSTCTRIRPTTLQIEMHPHNSQERLVQFAREAGMRVTAFSVFGASSYIELNMAKSDDLLMQDTTIVQLARDKKKTPAQILLRWAIQRNTMPLSKTCTASRMQENRNVFDFYLTGSEMKRIDALNKNKRYNDPGDFCTGMGTFCPIYD